MKKAWHILDDSMESYCGYEGPWKIGEERSLDADEEVQICWKGYHSSPTPADALSYAEAGRYLCQVLVSTPVEQDRDKQVSRTRKLVSAIDLDKLAASMREEKGTERFLLPQLNERADEALANLQQGNDSDPDEAREGIARLIDELDCLISEINDAEKYDDDDNPFGDMSDAKFNKLVKAAFARPDRKFHVKTDRHGNVKR